MLTIFVEELPLCCRIERQLYIYLLSVKYNNILLFILTYWRQVAVLRPSSGHRYIKYKTGYLQCTLISYLMGSHKTYINVNTFAASYLNTQGLNNSCLKSPASTLVDLTFQSRALRSFSLKQLRNLSL